MIHNNYVYHQRKLSHIEMKSVYNNKYRNKLGVMKSAIRSVSQIKTTYTCREHQLNDIKPDPLSLSHIVVGHITITSTGLLLLILIIIFSNHQFTPEHKDFNICRYKRDRHQGARRSLTYIVKQIHRLMKSGPMNKCWPSGGHTLHICSLTIIDLTWAQWIITKAPRLGRLNNQRHQK